VSATELCFTPATELSALIQSLDLSPVELADAVIARIERLNPTLNAFLTFTPEIARENAKAAETRALRFERRGPLDGIPYSI
jgi:Asp-tRNA(Asn)/Glu-tRNA(Gln) amidotransferase A subunit family amidase